MGDDKFLHHLSQSESGTLLLAAQSIISDTHWNCHSSGQTQDLFAVHISSRKRFFASQSHFKPLCFCDRKKASCARAHTKKYDPGREHRHRVFRSDFSFTDPLFYGISWVLEDGILNRCISKDHIVVAGF